MNSPVARESGEKVEIQPFWTPHFLAFLAQNGIFGKLEVHKHPLFNDLQFRRRMVPGVVSTRSLALTVETTLARRGCKAGRLDAAALPAPLDGAPGTGVGWTPTRGAWTRPHAVRLSAAPGALGRRREGPRRWTRHAGRSDSVSPRAGTAIRRQTSAVRYRHDKEVPKHLAERPRATDLPRPYPAGLPENPGTDTTPREPPAAPSRGRYRSARERPICSKPRMRLPLECKGTQPGSASGDHIRHRFRLSCAAPSGCGADRMGHRPPTHPVMQWTGSHVPYASYVFFMG